MMKRLSHRIKPNTFNRIFVLAILCAILAGIVGTRVYATSFGPQPKDDGECWYWMNRAHDGAEIARRLGGDNEEVLAYFGRAWTEYNELRKELVAQKQEAARKAEEERKASMEYLGVWTLTAYANDGQSASGRPNIAGQTCACNCLPFGSVIYVEGMGEYVVTDRGASSGQWAWHNSNWADLYMPSNAECNQWGVQHREVYLVK